MHASYFLDTVGSGSRYFFNPSPNKSLLASPGAGRQKRMITGGPRNQSSVPVPEEGYIPLKSMAMTIPLPAGLLKFEPGAVIPSFRASAEGESPATASTNTSSPLPDVPLHRKSFFTASATEKLQLHKAGQCYPCVAFAFKAAGCYKGDSCSHCHFCTASEATQRRRQLQAAARQQRRKQRPADPGNETTARILAGESFWL
ncbi:unnamed protein product [Symbiodinium sp. CCMP2592]|nr:unnamed protein product [Symbiodinium sp. CCMP2592]